MRPPPIVNFERAYLLSIALGAVSVAAYWADLRRLVPGGTLAAVAAVLLAVMVALVLLVSRRRSVVAKWVLVILTVASVALSVPSIGASLAAGPRGWLGIAQMLLQLAAIVLLFTAPARAWLGQPRHAL